MFRARNQHATGPQQENKRHGHNVQVKHNKAIKQHVTGTYHGKQRHGMILLNA